MSTMEENHIMMELERKPFSESMRVRCPYCRKLYLVQFGDIKEAKPRFECVQCRTRFWLSLPDMDLSSELTGIPIQMKEAPEKLKSKTVATQPCPKCFRSVARGSSECGHCGVVFEKIKEMDFLENRPPAHSDALASAWKQILANYGNEKLHDGFIRLAERENHLPYAATQYARMATLMASDETTQKRIDQIRVLATHKLPPPEAREARPFSRLWQIPLFASALMVIVGMTLPVFRHIVGVGAALLFLSFMLKFQTRSRN